LDLSGLIQPGEVPLLFYPSEDAVELTPDFVAGLNGRVHLIVPDGNWRQAAKVHSREPVLKDLPRVRIGRVNTAIHHLRREHRPEGMSTLEAIAHALSVIEGRAKVEALFTLYQAKLQQTLLGRGIKTDSLQDQAHGTVV
jgi:DTW domain-containing protein YfiP